MRDFWTWLKETYEEGDPNWWKPQEDRDDELLNNLGDKFGFNVPKPLSDTQKMNRQFNPPRKADPYSWNAWHGQSSSHTDEIFMQDIQYDIRDAITNNQNGLWCTMPDWGLNGMRQTDPETGDRHPNDDNSGDVIKNIAYIEVMKNNDVKNAFHLDADMPDGEVDSFMNHVGRYSYLSPSDHYDPNDSDMVKETLSRIPKVKIVIGGSMDQDERSSGKNNPLFLSHPSTNDAHIVYMELQRLNQEQLLQRMQNLQRMTADQAAQSIIDYCKKKLGTGPGLEQSRPDPHEDRHRRSKAQTPWHPGWS